MNLKQLKYVIVLSEQGSFSRAAEELNISQPSLSQYIKKIENELGMDLFDRSGSELRLTDAGREYISAGREILNIEHRMMDRFSDIREDRTGTIVIGVSPHRSVCILPAAIARFHKQYPGIEVTVDERVGQELMDRAERGEYDICISTTPVDEKIFEYEHILKDECVLTVPKEGSFAEKLTGSAQRMTGRAYPAVDITNIDGQDFVTLSEPQLMQKILQNICNEYAMTVRPTVVCKSLGAVLAMVEEGLGAAILPMSLVRKSDGRIKCFSIIQDIPHRDIVALYRKEQHRTKAVKELTKILIDING